MDNPVSIATQDPHAASIVNTSQPAHVSPPIVEPDGARSSTFNDPVPDHFVRMLDLTNPHISDYTLDMSSSSMEEPPLALSTLAPVRAPAPVKVVTHLKANYNCIF